MEKAAHSSAEHSFPGQWGKKSKCRVAENGLEEAYRILKKKGILYITVPCQHILFQLFTPILSVKQRLGRLIFEKTHDRPFLEYRFTKRAFKKYLADQGFDILEEKALGRDVGFSRIITSLLAYGGMSKPALFHKNNNDPFEGLTDSGNKICFWLNKISPWMTSDQIFIVAIKK